MRSISIWTRLLPSLAALLLLPLTARAASCVDGPIPLAFGAPPVLGSSGTIRLFNAGGTLVDSITLGNAASAQRSIGGAVSDNGTVHLFNYSPVLISGSTALLTFHRPLFYGQTYYVTIDPGVFQGSSGFSDANTLRLTTKTAPPPSGASRLVVAADGSGDFCTVQGAIDSVPVNNASPVLIQVRKGVYNEIIYVVPNKPFITVRGDDRDQTIIQYTNNDALNVAPVSNANNQCIQRRIPGTPDLYNCWRSLVGLETTDFRLENITLHNTTPYGGTQAEAFRGNNDRIVLDHVNLLSFQDTLRMQTSGFISHSYIEGDVDFTWGTGAAFFWQNELKSVHAGYVSQVRNDTTTHGFVYLQNWLTRAAGVADSSTYLSRIEPLRFAPSEAVFINTVMDKHILPVGFQLNPSTVNCGQAPSIHFWEYGSVDLTGSPVIVGQRLACSAQITADLARQYSDPATILSNFVPNTIDAVGTGVSPGPTPGPFLPNSIVNVAWSAPPGHSVADRISLFHAGDLGGTAVFTQLAGSSATLGASQMQLPAGLGAYQLGYLTPDGSTVLAVSGTINVTALCDVDGNGQIDARDITAIVAARNSRAAGGDARDADGDGTLSVLDARSCAAHCTKAGCAP